MTLTRRSAAAEPTPLQDGTAAKQPDDQRTEVERTPEQAVLDEYKVSLQSLGRPVSQRYLAEKYGIDRRKVKQLITSAEQSAPA